MKSKINIALLKKIRNFIKREPNKFRMDEWNCKTAGCIAGTACTLSGYKPAFDEDLSLEITGLVRLGRNRPERASLVAQRLLRLSPQQADDLFLWEGTPWTPKEREQMENACSAGDRVEQGRLAIRAIDRLIARSSPKRTPKVNSVRGSRPKKQKPIKRNGTKRKPKVRTKK